MLFTELVHTVTKVKKPQDLCLKARESRLTSAVLVEVSLLSSKNIVSLRPCSLWPRTDGSIQVERQEKTHVSTSLSQAIGQFLCSKRYLTDWILTSLVRSQSNLLIIQIQMLISFSNTFIANKCLIKCLGTSWYPVKLTHKISITHGSTLSASMYSF